MPFVRHTDAPPGLPVVLWLLNNCHPRPVKAYVDSLPTCGRATELAGAGSLQRLQHDAQALVLDRNAIAKLGTRQHRAGGQKIKDLLLETASPFRPELGNCDLRGCKAPTIVHRSRTEESEAGEISLDIRSHVRSTLCL